VSTKLDTLAAESAGRKKFGVPRFGTVAGVVVGLLVGLGVTVLRSAHSASVLPLAASASVNPLPSAAGSAEARLSYEEQLARQIQAHTEAIAKHDREVRDPAWATAAEKSIKDSLATLTTAGKFRTTSIDCRSASCVALVRVASYADAMQVWPSIVQAPNDTDCGTEVTLSPAQAGVTPYDFSVVYDCSQRAKTP